MATASKCLIFTGNVLQPAIWAIRGGAWQFDPQCSPPGVALISPYQAFFFSVAGSFDGSRNDSHSYTGAFLESAKDICQ